MHSITVYGCVAPRIISKIATGSARRFCWLSVVWYIIFLLAVSCMYILSRFTPYKFSWVICFSLYHSVCNMWKSGTAECVSLWWWWNISGYGGELCDDCVKLPGCMNGYCKKSFECHCNDGWTGLFCNQRKFVRPRIPAGEHPSAVRSWRTWPLIGGIEVASESSGVCGNGGLCPRTDIWTDGHLNVPFQILLLTWHSPTRAWSRQVNIFLTYLRQVAFKIWLAYYSVSPYGVA